MFRVQYSIITVSDMARSVAFYRDIVGMPLRFETPGWAEFETVGATWALHLCAVSDTEFDPSRESPGQCRAAFQVADLDAFHTRMAEHRVPCVGEPRETFGTRIAQYTDPDGMVFSVSESASAR
jgi:lactoylglutathione lyase